MRPDICPGVWLLHDIALIFLIATMLRACVHGMARVKVLKMLQVHCVVGMIRPGILELLDRGIVDKFCVVHAH